MANLTKSIEFIEIKEPKRQRYGTAAGAINFFKGALLTFNTDGDLVVGVDTANFIFAGIATEELLQPSGTLAQEKNIELLPVESGSWLKMKSNVAIDDDDIGKQVFLVDDELVDFNATSNNIVVGRIMAIIDASFIFVAPTLA